MASNHSEQVSLIWANTLARYKEVTGKKLDDPVLLGISSTNSLFKAIDSENEAFSSFRESKRGLFEVLGYALRPIELFGNLAAGGASIAFPPSSLVFGAVSYLINAGHGVSAAYDAIQDLFESLKVRCPSSYPRCRSSRSTSCSRRRQDFTVRLKVYDREDISGDLQEKLAESLTTLIEIFALSTRLLKEKRVVKFFKNVFIGNDAKIQAAVERLAKLVKSEDSLVGAETLTETKKTGRAIDGVAVTVTATNVAVTRAGMRVDQISLDIGDFRQEMRDELGKVALSMGETRSEGKDDKEKDKAHLKQLKALLIPSIYPQGISPSP